MDESWQLYLIWNKINGCKLATSRTAVSLWVSELWVSQFEMDPAARLAFSFVLNWLNLRKILLDQAKSVFGQLLEQEILKSDNIIHFIFSTTTAENLIYSEIRKFYHQTWEYLKIVTGNTEMSSWFGWLVVRVRLGWYLS